MGRPKVILFCTLAAMAYGIVHDEITAWICLEYFTVAHPPLFHTRSPTMLAVCWGAAATAAIGLTFGVVLALVSHSAGLPPVSLGRLWGRIFRLLTLMALSAFAAGCVGFYLSRHSLIRFPTALAEAIPAAQHDPFMAVWFAHVASYLVGFAGSASLVASIWRERGRPAVLAVYPQSGLGVVRAVLVGVVVALVVWWRFFALR